MHVSFVEYFVDPKTKEPLVLEATESKGDFVESGFLKSSTNKYPIVRGIPRFVDYESQNYSKSFGYQWHRWPRVQFEAENVGKPMAGYTRKMWERITGITGDLTGKTIVDIGCGPGRFSDVARSKGAKVIGIDFSSAVEMAAKNLKDDPNVCICQADALNLPIKPGSIDGAFTIGVLHHTPNPKEGVNQAFHVLKDPGWFSICVYSKGGYYDFPTVQLWRKLFNVLWKLFGHIPALIYTYCIVYLFWPIARVFPILDKPIRALFPFCNLPDINWSILDTFDSVTPTYQSAHESFEVFSWLKSTGFSQIEPTDWGFTSFRGTKGK